MPYRDEQAALAALEIRRDEIRQELGEIKRKAEALREAVKSEAALAEELADLEARLSRSASRRLPLLQQVRVASPCSASWEAMRGDAQVRFCEGCQKNVYNLSAMTRVDAEALLVKHEGQLCVRVYQRADGTVMTADCPVGVRRKRVRRIALSVAGAGVLAAGAAAATTTTMGKPEVVMGGIEPVAVTGQAAVPPPETTTWVDTTDDTPKPRHVMGKVAWPTTKETPKAPPAKPPVPARATRSGTK
jgi:hypothetical protein